jgi:hypothetical protein
VAWHLADGEVAASIADVALLEAQLPKLLKLHSQDIQRAPLLVLDGNMPQQSILVSPLSLHVLSAFQSRILFASILVCNLNAPISQPSRLMHTRMVS